MKVLAASALSMLGLLLVGFALLRLGWRRHGTPWWDLSFLHLDWVLHPALPYWGAHVQNLTVLVAGVVSLAAAAIVLRRRNRDPH